jgi:anti-sigma B factor antagonist
MEIEVRSQQQVQVLKLRGKLALGDSVDKLRETLDNLIDRGDLNFVLDLAEVPMIDSSGIGLLVRSLTSLKQRNGSVKLVSPSRMVQQTLKMIGLINLFPIFDDQASALESFS